MKRYLCWLALLGLMFVPDWASACWPIWGSPQPRAPLYVPPPIYTAPAYQPIYVHPPIYQPAPAWVSSPSNIEMIPRVAMPYPAPPTKTAPGKSAGTASAPSPLSPLTTPETGAAKTKPTPVPPKVEAIQPAGGRGIAPPISVKDRDAPIVIPDPVKPSPVVPMVDSSSGLPPLVLPKETEPRYIPKGSGPETPKKPVPSATPTPAPADPSSLLPSAPSKTPGQTLTLPGSTPSAVPSPAPGSFDQLIPPSVPLLPNSGKPDALPSLTLPPDVPISPVNKTDSTSRSSPLTGMAIRGMTVNVFPVVAAAKTEGGYRMVSFFNHTNRDLNLTIEGRSVKLPAKTFLETKLNQAFTWSYGDNSSATERVPNGASGLDVVFRNE